MKELSWGTIRNLPVGSYYLTYSRTEGYIGTNMWICRIEEGYLETQVKRMETYWCGEEMWDGHMEVSHSNSPQYYSHDTIELMGGIPLAFSEEDYHRYVMDFI